MARGANTPAGKLRRRLDISRPQLAALLGVDLRTVIRWEVGTFEPSGAGAAVLLALTVALERAGRAEPAMRRWLVQQVELGSGLTHVLLTLLSERFE